MQEQYLEAGINDLADTCGPLLERLAPDAFFNMTAFNNENMECRIGRGPIEKRPFSGTSSVMDFCAHAHHDANNMNNGTTMVSFFTSLCVLPLLALTLLITHCYHSTICIEPQV